LRERERKKRMKLEEKALGIDVDMSDMSVQDVIKTSAET